MSKFSQNISQLPTARCPVHSLYVESGDLTVLYFYTLHRLARVSPVPFRPISEDELLLEYGQYMLDVNICDLCVKHDILVRVLCWRFLTTFDVYCN